MRYSLVGVNSDGIEIYETSEDTKKLSYAERKKALLNAVLNEYKGRTAKFNKNGETYYAFYDEVGVRKNLYGDSKSDKNGFKAKVNIGADGNYIELAENARYTGSSYEIGKQTVSGYHEDATKANVPDANGKHQKQGIYSFDTRTVKFYDGNKAYDIMFSIATLESGEKVAYAKKFFGYDADLTKKYRPPKPGVNNLP